MMPKLGRLRFFSKPKDAKQWQSAMAAQYDSLKPGEILVYHHSLSPLIRKDGDVFDVAWRLSGQKELPLVQWPEEPCGGNKNKVRRWFYGIQKPGQAA